MSLLQVTMGVMTGAWGARAPAIRAAIAADDRTWGAVNAVPVVGDVLALFLVFALAVCGMGLAIGIATPTSSVAGFALLALGMACTGPVVWGQVDRLANQVSASEAASMIDMGYLPGQYISPLLIGIAASALGLRAALLIVVAGLAAMVALQIATGRRGEST